MANKGRRHYWKFLSEERKGSVSGRCHKLSRDRLEKDRLLAVWVLHRIGWSARRIARLQLPSSHHTVSSCIEKAWELIDADELPILSNSEKSLKMSPFGSATDIEYIHGKITANDYEREDRSFYCED